MKLIHMSWVFVMLSWNLFAFFACVNACVFSEIVYFYYSFMQCNLDFLFRQFVLVCCIKHLCIFDTLFLVVRNNTLFLVVRNNILRIWSYQYTGLASFLNWFRIHSPTLYQVEDEEEEEICWYWRYLLSWLVNWFKRNGLESACFYFSVFRLSWFKCQIPMV